MDGMTSRTSLSRIGGGRVAGDSDNTARSDAAGARLVPAPYQSQASFVAAIRRGEPAALRQLFLFYAPLLRDQARTMSIPPEERDEMVTTLLDDVVLRLQDAELPPRELGRYLVGALRNRARNRHRDRKRRHASSERAYSEHGRAAERIVAECHSSYGLEQAAPPGDESPPLRSAIEKLATKSALALTDVERELMVGLSRRIPLRELAEEAGLTYGAARVRVHRLRERFLKLAIQHVASLEDAEKREMERFFRRAGVPLEPDEVAGRGTRAGDRRSRHTSDTRRKGTDDTA
jgi:RNA polymerase sigma factor (sigma-70 family)